MNRRRFIENLVAAGAVSALTPNVWAQVNKTKEGAAKATSPELRFVLDMVHDNPGEAPFVTKFKDTALLKSWGYTGQIPKLFLQCAITYDGFDADLLPLGSKERAWSEKTAAEIDSRLHDAQVNNMPLYPFTDVLVVPKALLAKYGNEMRDGGRLSILKPLTQRVMREQINEIFDRFPGLGGITIRFGETYLQDTPFHAGGSPVSSAEEHQVLIALLREEVCVKRNKILFYRTWALGTGNTNIHIHKDFYLKVTDAIEPHPNMVFSIKHTNADFLRAVPFNETLGFGKHPQLVEVSTMQAGIYGKNAHPYYIGQGVIDGWEEMGEGKKGLKDLVGLPQFAGVWTWTRGDGWAGPYISNEFWVNLNAWVISHFGQEPSKTEPELFDEYARTQLKLDKASTAKLRELCLLATSATFHGQQSSLFSANPWWCRDEYLTAVNLDVVVEKGIVGPVLEEKAKAVADWTRVEGLSREIRLTNPADQEFLQVSSTYGRIKIAVMEQIWIMQILSASAHKNGIMDTTAMKTALESYDALWREWRQLKENYACCPTLYTDTKAVNVGPVLKPILDNYRLMVAEAMPN